MAGAARISLPCHRQIQSAYHHASAHPVIHLKQLFRFSLTSWVTSIDWIVKTTCLWSCHSTHILICDISFHGLSAVLAVTPDNESSAQVRILTRPLDLHSLYGLTAIHQGPSPGNVVISISSNFSSTLQMLISAGNILDLQREDNEFVLLSVPQSMVHTGAQKYLSESNIYWWICLYSAAHNLLKG